MFLDFGHYVWFGPIIFTLADLTAIKENVRWHYVTAKCIEFLVNDNWTILIGCNISRQPGLKKKFPYHLMKKKKPYSTFHNAQM